VAQGKADVTVNSLISTIPNQSVCNVNCYGDVDQVGHNGFQRTAPPLQQLAVIRNDHLVQGCP
jgi:hypothetical protein